MIHLFPGSSSRRRLAPGPEQRLCRDSTVPVSRPGLGLDEPRVAQFVPAGLPGPDKLGERGGLLHAMRSQEYAGGSPCLLYPGSIQVSSVFISGALAESMLERKRRIKQLSWQFYSQSLRSGLLRASLPSRAHAEGHLRKKQQQKLASIFSLSPCRILRPEKKSSSRLISLHPLPQIKDLGKPEDVGGRGLPQSRPISLRGANYPN